MSITYSRVRRLMRLRNLRTRLGAGWAGTGSLRHL